MTTCDLRLGDWRRVLSDVERCWLLLTDPPYSSTAHEGQSDEPALEQRIEKAAQEGAK